MQRLTNEMGFVEEDLEDVEEDLEDESGDDSNGDDLDNINGDDLNQHEYYGTPNEDQPLAAASDISGLNEKVSQLTQELSKILVAHKAKTSLRDKDRWQTKSKDRASQPRGRRTLMEV